MTSQTTMTPIAGIYRFDGRPVDAGAIERMLGRMWRAGDGEVAVWCDGEIGLGRIAPDMAQAVATTASGCKVVADARLDNRRALAALCGDGRGCAGEAAANALIGASYDRWGEQCPTQLIGDYAFAVWDAKQRALFCARDHFGIRPFFYYAGSTQFVFASELDALLDCADVPRRINALRVGLHLAVLVAENRMTFYTDVIRLEPAHSLRVERESAPEIKRYWSLDAVPMLHLPSDAAYAEAFRDCLTEAVRCRLPDAPVVGSLFSGGLDSTAVTCLVRELIQTGSYAGALHTVSAVFKQTPESDERPFIQETLNLGGIEPHFVDVEAAGPLSQIDEMLAVVGEPFSAPTLYVLWSLYAEAKRQGLAVLLDGVDGDTAVHHGDAYLAELARVGDWKQFFDLAKAIGLRSGRPAVDHLMRRYGAPHLRRLAQHGQWPKLYRELRRLAPFMMDSPHRLFYEHLRRYGLQPLFDGPRRRMARRFGQDNGRRGSDVAVPLGLAGERLRRETGLTAFAAEVMAETAAPIETSRQEHYQLLNAPLIPHLFELSSTTARHFGLDVRHPFADRRLIEFCYALPPQQKMVDGWTRHIVRRALAGTIPDAIRWRGGKAENSAAVTKAFRRQGVRCIEAIVQQNGELIADYVDVDRLRETLGRYQVAGGRQDEMLLWQSASLAIWLRQQTEKQV